MDVLDGNEVNEENREFEERSDYIRDEDLLAWNVSSPYFEDIQKQLLNTGAKLLVGPRGTGKTHQMKIAYQSCISGKEKPAAIFISLNKYFYLEPLLTKAPNAIQIFHSWVLCKILLGCNAYMEACNVPFENGIVIDDIENPISVASLKEFENKAESPISSRLDEDIIIQKLSIGTVHGVIDKMLALVKKPRAIIFLDDAALTLTPDYFKEFLDIFRGLKTTLISPKASVYPGTTQYSGRFHVGHDAQVIQCWMSVEDKRYSSFMDSLIDARFPKIKTTLNSDILELIKYASFGIPRSFITLVSNYLDPSSIIKTEQSKFNTVIEQRSKLIGMEYLSLKEKMPQYADIIEIGWELFKKVVADLKTDNQDLIDEKNIVIGIQDESNKMTDRMIGFLREAGLMYEEESTVKHGPQREYRRFIPHLLFLLENRTFSKGSRGFSSSEMLAYLTAKPKKHPLRRTFKTLLDGRINNLKLNLPPCQVCNTPRLTEEQKFCHNCGSQLVNKSSFEHCLNIHIDHLPLTPWQKDQIKNIQITTIGDFLALTNPGGELRKIKGIGPKKSEKITNTIQGTVKEILDRTLTDFLS